MAIYFRPDLHWLAGRVLSPSTGMEHTAAIAEPGNTDSIEQMRIYSRHLGSDVRAKSHHPAGNLVHEFEGAQIEILARSG